jgi:Protein of unknown function DUF115
MSLAIAVVTTFPDSSWDVYAKRMLESFVANWPDEIPIMVQIDTPNLSEQINKVLRPQDGLQSGWQPEHAAFVERNKGKDDPQDYRKQAVRFCHKVFTLKNALDSVNDAIAAGHKDVCRYLIWLDADVLTTRKVTIDDLRKCLPKEGDAVSYMGRKDWDHSECGWLAFDLENGGSHIIERMWLCYTKDTLFDEPQWHDSWIFDHIKVLEDKWTNLTPDAIGMEVWPQSPMAAWSRHYKGPIAKQELAQDPPKKQGGMQPLKIQTCNSIPNDDICRSILENQAQIKNWVTTCKVTDEEIVVVSAGPMLIAEDILEEVKYGRKIVAVKHALEPLKAAGIKPWACILLDPREHVADFVKEPDKDIIWLVASQVTPLAVKRLLDAGCNVWGYHASVGAGETKYTDKQSDSIVDGGSATSTRGLFVLEKLGFRRFRLYGYDLCFAKKPDLGAKDDRGQPANFEIEIGYQLPFYKDYRMFWSRGELLAQADEFRQIMESKSWQIRAFGNGIVPFLANIRRVNDLRKASKIGKISSKPIKYEDLFKCKNRTQLSMRLLNMLPKILHKQKMVSNF